MKFTVREISDTDITVDFPDGTWANVPAPKGPLTKSELCEWILQFNPTQFTWEEMPFDVGETIEFDAPTKEPENPEPDPDPKMDYREMRKTLYPKLHDQMDAAYWARQGNTTQQEEIDAAILEVKNSIPKDTEPMTRAELTEFLTQ